MENTILSKALVSYLMAMTFPQLLSIPRSPEEDNPFVNVDGKIGRRYCILSSSDLKTFQEETGIELTKASILSCSKLSELEEMMAEAAEAEKVSAETVARMVLQLISAIGKAWINLELVEDIDEISDGNHVNPAYIWPDYPVERASEGEK